MELAALTERGTVWPSTPRGDVRTCSGVLCVPSGRVGPGGGPVSTSRWPSVRRSGCSAPARRPAPSAAARRTATALTAGVLLAALTGCGDPGGGGGGGGYVVGTTVAGR